MSCISATCILIGFVSVKWAVFQQYVSYIDCFLMPMNSISAVLIVFLRQMNSISAIWIVVCHQMNSISAVLIVF